MPILKMIAFGVLGGLLIVVTVVQVTGVAASASVGMDYDYYRAVGARWLADGTYYLPSQLDGPYDVRLMVDVMYPPAALLLFVPLSFAPAILWWVVPLGILGYVIWTWRPSALGWIAMLAICLWPRLQGAILFGNTDMWVAAGVAAGLRWGWPAALIALKPIFLPLALVGARNPFFWLAAMALFLVSLPLLGDYVTALRNVRIGADYSVGSLPFIALPVVAWMTRTVRGAQTERAVVIQHWQRLGRTIGQALGRTDGT